MLYYLVLKVQVMELWSFGGGKLAYTLLLGIQVGLSIFVLPSFFPLCYMVVKCFLDILLYNIRRQLFSLAVENNIKTEYREIYKMGSPFIW